MKKVLPLLLFVLVAWSDALAGPLTNLVVFGDSLSDQGNAFALTGGAFPPPPYVQRASNGPAAVEHVAQQLGVLLAPAALGGTNYAVVGATTGAVLNPATGTLTENIAVGQFGIPVLEGTGILNQVAMFLAAAPIIDPDGSLFFLWGGANDLFINPSAPTALGAVTNLTTAIQSLYAGGARNFFVPNLPDLSLTPFGRSLPPLAAANLRALTIGFNTGLGDALTVLSQLPGMNLASFDTFALSSVLAANPGAFGFADAALPCVTGNPVVGFSVCPAPDSFVYWDNVHPTAAAHALLGDAFAAAVPAVPEPAVLSLIALGLAGARARRYL